MKRVFVLFIAVFMQLVLMAQDKPAYRIFDSQGNPVQYQEMIAGLSGAQAVFFGELHSNPIAHWLELEVTKSLYGKTGGNIVQGAEMFEADVQLILDEFLAGYIREKDVKTEARVWPNYETDYKPLLMFAKDHSLKFIATNIPRRYANLVYRKGFEGLNDLSAQAKSYIAPLPIKYDSNLKCYKDMLDGMVHMGMPANPNIAKAQAIKDATMAYFISRNLPSGGIFIHYNGSYHSDNHLGIVWYLEQYKPGIKIKTITTVEQEDLSALEDDNKGIADYIVVVPKDMTQTY